MLLRNAWYIAAWADELGAEPLARRICNDPVVLFRDGAGKAAALADRCCHRAAPLHLGSVVEAGIQCGYHGLVFDGAGRCVAIPGQRLIPDDARVRAYPLVEKNQLVWMWMGDPALADPAEIVDFPYHDDPAHWPNKHDVYPIKGNYMLMVDNLMDLTHLGYLHAKTVGGNPGAHVEAEMKTTRTPTGLKFTRWMRNSVPPPSYVKAAGFQGRVDRCQEFEFVAPSTRPAMDRRDRCRHRHRRPAARFPLPVPPVPRPDAGDRDQLLLFLVGGQRLPPERARRRPSSSTARSRRPFSRTRRWSRRSRRGSTNSAKRASPTSPRTPTACTCGAWSSA